jgi:hypothetical protein
MSGRLNTPTVGAISVFSVAISVFSAAVIAGRKSVVTLTVAVAGNTTCGRVLWRHRVSVFEWHRSPLTGSRCEIRWLGGRGKTLTFSVIPAFSVAVTEKSCDACGIGGYNLR